MLIHCKIQAHQLLLKFVLPEYKVLSFPGFQGHQPRGEDKRPDPNVHEAKPEVLCLGEPPRVDGEVNGQDAESSHVQHRCPVVGDVVQPALCRGRVGEALPAQSGLIFWTLD